MARWMNTPTVRTLFMLARALLTFAVFGATAPTFACVVGTATSATCTEATLDACLPGGGSYDGTVTFDCGVYTTIYVSNTKHITFDTTIDGTDDGGVITIDGTNSAGVFFVDSGVTFTVDNLGIEHGLSLSGGAIFNGGTLMVTNSTFSFNSATQGGGAIANSGTAIVTNSTFSGNAGGTPPQSAAAIANRSLQGRL